VAPGPASGEDASLQVGPESDWRSDRCSCAPVAAITVGPPIAMPTVAPIPTADWPVTIILNGTHYRKRLNFRGLKTHENKLKPTKIAYFRR
jgi:hypothetical protein